MFADLHRFGAKAIDSGKADHEPGNGNDDEWVSEEGINCQHGHYDSVVAGIVSSVVGDPAECLVHIGRSGYLVDIEELLR